ncbi:hypothetical protein OEG84_04755 [Hoeflea sp. G2-23]|uniref:Tyr recombinase domain-containing protein n=1 Tax=Hoeflea algicola TaxID=2983763 RepID=A0ABT3Z5Q2_9HYPH|nr:hypothetical protein [Hoeflea algicola]MCY0147046.1 hypothetical protein [Hoeflea algicola]
MPTRSEARRSPQEVLLSDVLNHYVEHKYPPASRAAQLIILGLEDVTPYPKVSDLTLTNQRRVWKHIYETHGLKAKSISTYMIALRAAVNYSARPQIVEVDGKLEEVQLLNDTIPVMCNQDEIADYLGAERSVGRAFLPTFEQVAKWIDSIEHESDFRYVVIALNTWARNSAIFDMRVNAQIDFEYGLVNLNPEGRRQTKKRRPVIRLTNNLRSWLRYWGTTARSSNTRIRLRSA